jgi:hypothetical protein
LAGRAKGRFLAGGSAEEGKIEFVGLNETSRLDSSPESNRDSAIYLRLLAPFCNFLEKLNRCYF